MNIFGDNLKKTRKSLKMNQTALGDAIGVGQTTIANYETGLRFPTGDLLKKIAEILNVSIDELMGHHVINGQPITEEFDVQAYRDAFVQHLINGEEQAAIVMVWDLSPSSENLLFIYEEILARSMYIIGDLWASGELGVASEHFASQVVHKILAMLSTIPAEAPKNGKKALCMSIGEEPHTIGIKMVSEYLNFLGIQSHFIGTNVPIESLLEMLLKTKFDLLAISVTTVSHMVSLKQLIESVRQTKQLKELNIILGGQVLENDFLDMKSFGVSCISNNFASIKECLVSRHLVA